MVTLECVEKLIRKDMVDPVNGEKLTDRDIIVLQRVSCGLARRGSAPSSLTSPGPRPSREASVLHSPARDLPPGSCLTLYGLGLSHPAAARPAPNLALSPPPQGGTGFAGSGVKLQAEKSRPVMQA